MNDKNKMNKDFLNISFIYQLLCETTLDEENIFLFQFFTAKNLKALQKLFRLTLMVARSSPHYFDEVAKEKTLHLLLKFSS